MSYTIKPDRRAITMAALTVATLLSCMATTATVANVESPFGQLNGNWTGAGQASFSGGTSEALKCKAYYKSKEASSLGLAILCASPSSKIELRATLNLQAGQVVGSWEERNFNASGIVNGQATANSLTLAISGGGVSGAITVGIKGPTQTVTISTEGTSLAGVSINLSR